MKSIRNKLSLATCSLLSAGNASAEAVENAWEVDGSYLFYSEEDRVTVNKLVGGAKGFVSNTDTASIKVVFDSMSGATPSGAVKESSLSFTGASGGTGVTPENDSAALSKFDDTRVGVSLDWIHEHTRTLNVNYNGAFSVENDYRSFSAAATANKENESRSVKYSLGIAGTFDQIFRVNGNNTPAPVTRVADQIFLGEGERTTTDIIAGITRIINRRTVGQINLAFGLSNGYHTDPYKIFSIVDANGIEWDQYFEGRPDSRIRWSITGNLNHQLYPGNNTMYLSYRYYSDDWGVQSHTLDYSHRYVTGKSRYWEPRIRLYTQTAADFYQNSFFKDPADPTPLVLPEFISADYRLDAINDVTLGLTYGINFSRDSDFRTRLEYFYQSFEDSEFDTNKAIIFQISYTKRF